jgi:hypothetical protein
VTDNARDILEQYVSAGKLMQVATVSRTGHPEVCNVWYHVQFRPDWLYFTSRHDRAHSVNIRNDEHVAGAIIAMPLVGLGQKVTGVTFKGRALQLGLAARGELAAFTARWPLASDTISIDRLARHDTPSRLYAISIDEWVLFDEVAFPDSPRQIIAGWS